jgi:hypothetical protein
VASLIHENFSNRGPIILKQGKNSQISNPGLSIDFGIWLRTRCRIPAFRLISVISSKRETKKASYESGIFWSNRRKTLPRQPVIHYGEKKRNGKDSNRLRVAFAIFSLSSPLSYRSSMSMRSINGSSSEMRRVDLCVVRRRIERRKRCFSVSPKGDHVNNRYNSCNIGITQCKERDCCS